MKRSDRAVRGFIPAALVLFVLGSYGFVGLWRPWHHAMYERLVDEAGSSGGCTPYSYGVFYERWFAIPDWLPRVPVRWLFFWWISMAIVARVDRDRRRSQRGLLPALATAGIAGVAAAALAIAWVAVVWETLRFERLFENSYVNVVSIRADRDTTRAWQAIAYTLDLVLPAVLAALFASWRWYFPRSGRAAWAPDSAKPELASESETPA